MENKEKSLESSYKLNGEEVNKVIDVIIENFKENESRINDLNVFPVPDGDTGTNMLLTLKSIKDEVSKLKIYTLKSVGDAVSLGGLMGARGNSGVILSQILKGFFDILNDEESFNLDALERALKSSKNLAYNSVQNPTEGTMLTTIKDIYNVVKDLPDNNPGNINLEGLLNSIIKEGKKSVIRTTDLLPVLKEAGVVDAGAQGILDIIIGLKKALVKPGKVYISLKKSADKKGKKVSVSLGSAYDYKDKYGNLKDIGIASDTKYIYCTELLVEGNRIEIDRFREYIESLGDSVLIVGNENLVKVHVHTTTPYKVLKRALKEGTLHDIKINNISEKSTVAGILEKEEKKEVRKAGLVAVANGDGLEEIFKSLGVDMIIKGGQSMNPSTYDITKAIKGIGAEKVYVLPNNKNIILSANQAKKIVKDTDVIIIPTKTIPQGITATLNYNPDSKPEENIYNMEEAIKKTKSGEVTIAVRDTKLSVGKIKKGDFIGLSDGKVRIISDNVADAVIGLVKDMVLGSEELITFYTGQDAKPEDNDNIKSDLKKYCPKLEVEFQKGGQPFYPYIFSIE